MKISARNELKGKVKSVNHGAVNSEITVELPGGQEIVSIITKSSAERLGLKPGAEAYAVVQATHMMIGNDDGQKGVFPVVLPINKLPINSEPFT